MRWSHYNFERRQRDQNNHLLADTKKVPPDYTTGNPETRRVGAVRAAD